MRAFFYDTWAFAALANTRDAAHSVAGEADEWLEEQAYVPVTSDYVLDESLTLLHAAAGARCALRFDELIQARVDAGELELVRIGASRWLAAREIFRRLAPDTPRLSFTDCTSFAVMRELGVELAFTVDKHFEKAGRGIRPLFRRDGKVVKAVYPEA